MYLDELKALTFNNKLAGYQAKIRYWGANHGKNQAPPAPERWLTSIKVEITLFELLEFETEYLLIKHPYSDADSIGDTKIPCYTIKEVMAEKIRSLVQRSYTAPRDFYDIYALRKYIKDTDWKDICYALKNKMIFKGYTFNGIDQLINERSIDILNRSWEQSLGYQLQTSSLPDIETVIEDLSAVFKKYLISADS